MFANKNILGLVIIAIFMIIIFAFCSPVFLSIDNILNLLLASSTIGILSIGMAFVIGAGGLDLSMGSLMAFSAVVPASLFFVFGMDAYMIGIICLSVGLAIGCLNGLLISYIGIPAFIVTLGMMGIIRGLAFVFTNGTTIYGMPKTVLFIGQGNLMGIPNPIIILFCLMFLSHLILRKTVFGKYVLAIGDNEKASYNAGINVKLTKFKIYILSGVFASIAGLIFMGRVNAADPNAGLSYEMTAITAVIIGGAYLFGGRTSIVGAVLGAIVMSILQNGLNLLAVPSYYQHIIVGCTLIFAVGIEKFQNWRQECC